MVNLTDLGFIKGAVYETILSTYNKTKHPDAAPMGVIMQNPETITLNIFNSSQTKRNLETNRCGVINLTSDIELFYKTAFKEANPDGKLPPDWFVKAEVVNAPKLRLADAAIEVSVGGLEPIGMEKTKFTCKVEQINADKMCVQAYCRAMALTLEAIIHATRVKAFAKDKNKKEQVAELLQTIENFRGIVNRTAPDSAYSLVMADLTVRIDSWRNKP